MLDPLDLRPLYSAFLAPGRVLLTGHSHQAWPDAAKEGVLEAFADAAREVDDKWERAFAAAAGVRLGVAQRIGAVPSEIALAPNTWELLVRFLSALDLRQRPHLVTTTGEFQSLTRQLRRLDEQGWLPVTWVPARPVETLAQRLAESVRSDTAAVLTSTVLYETAEVVPGLPALVQAARAKGAEVLLDAYHAFYALPFTLQSLGAQDAFLVAGGYKYAQWGEGNCWLRVPPRGFRPVLTGWFAGFSSLSDPRGAPLSYGNSGAEAFAGSTYDPTSHYRARAVLELHEAAGLTVEALRELSLRQTTRLLGLLDGLDVQTPRAPAARGGFVAVRLPDAAGAVQALRAKGIVVDARGDLLRLGPAPYLLDEELDRAVAALKDYLARH